VEVDGILNSKTLGLCLQWCGRSKCRSHDSEFLAYWAESDLLS